MRNTGARRRAPGQQLTTRLQEMVQSERSGRQRGLTNDGCRGTHCQLQRLPFTAVQVERDFWAIVNGEIKENVVVEYGNDVDSSVYGTFFPKVAAQALRAQPPSAHRVMVCGAQSGYEAESGWNLNRMPFERRSLLQYLDRISGVTQPWVYVGMMFTPFCWHNEDHFCYSISYLHHGAPKQWYGVPGVQADLFEKVPRTQASWIALYSDRRAAGHEGARARLVHLAAGPPLPDRHAG